MILLGLTALRIPLVEGPRNNKMVKLFIGYLCMGGGGHKDTAKDAIHSMK